MWLRTATRVLVRITRFEARSFADLERELQQVPWSTWLDPDIPVRLRVTSTGSQLYHRGAIAERVLRVLGNPDASGRDPAPNSRAVDEDVDEDVEEDDIDEGDEQLVLIRAVHDQFTISIDSSGAPLYQRGWRKQTAKAPLRETMAAALLLATGWDATMPLVDPMCGSGTIAIEAALLARGIPPGHQRDFGFVRWPSFEPGTWASVAGAAQKALDEATARPVPLLIARDRDAGAIRAARANAERAGVARDLDLDVAAISHLTRPPDAPPGWLITNPPYGARVKGGADLRDLYARTGDVFRSQFAGWSAALLVADRALANQAGLDWSVRLATSNGGIPVELLTAQI
jgi:putative N6-adenine-specific DNA methylase